MLTVRNHALNGFYCTTLRRNKSGDYTENGKIPEIIMKENKNITVQVETTSKDSARCCNTPNSVLFLF